MLPRSIFPLYFLAFCVTLIYSKISIEYNEDWNKGVSRLHSRFYCTCYSEKHIHSAQHKCHWNQRTFRSFHPIMSSFPLFVLLKRVNGIFRWKMEWVHILSGFRIFSGREAGGNNTTRRYLLTRLSHRSGVCFVTSLGLISLAHQRSLGSRVTLHVQTHWILAHSTTWKDKRYLLCLYRSSLRSWFVGSGQKAAPGCA